MNILIIPAVFPSEKNSTAGIYIYEQACALYNAGHNVTVLDATDRNYKNWFSREIFNYRKTSQNGITIYAFNYPGILSSRLPKLASFCYGLCLQYLFKKAQRDNIKIDLIHSHFTFFSGYQALKLSKKHNLPFIVTEHFSLFQQSKINITLKKILIKTINHSDAFICVSNTMKTEIQRHYGDRINLIVIPNMINPIFKFVKPEKNKDFLFFSAGNLQPIKNMDVLIKAFSIAFKGIENVKLEIAGQGPEFIYLNEIIKKLKLENKISLLGNIGRKEMLLKFSECNAFVMVSKSETFGIVYREAMAVGRPIITSKNGGIVEGWNDNQGIIVPVDDIKATASALKHMKENIHCYDFKVISNNCLTLFSENTIVGELENIYHKVIKE